MAALTVGDLDDDLIQQLQRRAAAHGRSAEAEHREILRAALGEGSWAATRREAADRLAALQDRIAARGTVEAGDLLRESREARLRQLAGNDREDGR